VCVSYRFVALRVNAYLRQRIQRLVEDSTNGLHGRTGGWLQRLVSSLHKVNRPTGFRTELWFVSA
jgi:hypothetical protein